MIKINKIIFPLFLSSLLIGCSTTKDPRDANLLDSIVNLSNGEYEKGAEKDRRRLNLTVEERDRTKDVNQQLNNQQRTLIAKRKRVVASLYRLEDEIYVLDKQIKSQKNMSSQLQKEKSKRASMLSSIKIKLQNLKKNATNMDINKLQQKRDDLQQELKLYYSL